MLVLSAQHSKTQRNSVYSLYKTEKSSKSSHLRTWNQRMTNYELINNLRRVCAQNNTTGNLLTCITKIAQFTFNKGDATQCYKEFIPKYIVAA